MQLDFFILARHAESPNDLLNILGAGWDSVNVTETPAGLPDDAITVVNGTLVARILFHQITETNRNHAFSITLVDEDGGEVARLGGEFPVKRSPGIPVGWPQNTQIVMPLGIPVARFGTYTFALEVDGQHLGERSFRVLDARGSQSAQAA